MRSCKKERVVMVCAFLAISKRIRGIKRMRRDVNKVGSKDAINS